MQIINTLKKIGIYFRNIIVWLAPFFIFTIVLFLVIFFLGGNLEKYIELLKVLVWPITVLVVLFFFREVVTYMFFSMNEFNFFGVRGELKNVDKMIEEEVEKKFIKQKEELDAKEEMKKMEEKFNNTSTSAEENLQLARDIYKLYQDYKIQNEKKIQDIMIEIKNLKEGINTSPKCENNTPIFTDKPTTDLGVGEMIGNLKGTQPQNE